MFINQFKLMKFVKKGFKIIVKKPSFLLSENNRNINFHFDLMHGYNNLNKSIELLESEDRKDFAQFVNSKTSFNPLVCGYRIDNLPTVFIAMQVQG